MKGTYTERLTHFRNKREVANSVGEIEIERYCPDEDDPADDTYQFDISLPLRERPDVYPLEPLPQKDTALLQRLRGWIDLHFEVERQHIDQKHWYMLLWRTSEGRLVFSLLNKGVLFKVNKK